MYIDKIWREKLTFFVIVMKDEILRWHYNYFAYLFVTFDLQPLRTSISDWRTNLSSRLILTALKHCKNYSHKQQSCLPFCRIKRAEHKAVRVRNVETTSILRFTAMPVAILFKFKIQLGSGIFAGVVIIMTRELEGSKSDRSLKLHFRV